MDDLSLNQGDAARKTWVTYSPTLDGGLTRRELRGERGGIVGESAALRRVLAQVQQVAATDSARQGRGRNSLPHISMG